MSYEKFKIEKIETINKIFRIPSSLLEELQKTAYSKGISLNQLVVKCCEYALKNIED